MNVFAAVLADGRPTHVTLWYPQPKVMVFRNLEETLPFVRYEGVREGPQKIMVSRNGKDYTLPTDPGDLRALSRFLLLDPFTILAELGGNEEREELAHSILSKTEGKASWRGKVIESISVEELDLPSESRRPSFLVSGTYRPAAALSYVKVTDAMNLDLPDTSSFHTLFRNGTMEEFHQQDGAPGSELISTLFPRRGRLMDRSLRGIRFYTDWPNDALLWQFSDIPFPERRVPR